MNPYKELEGKHFWSTAVAKRNFFDIDELWDPKFQITPKMKVSTFGSCFAQHIGKALASRGFNWLITEKAPVGLSEKNQKKFNYGIFTARTGNIYTVSLLKQWIDWVTLAKIPPNEAWEEGGRFFDTFRPNIEDNGFLSKAEMIMSRNEAINSFGKALEESDVFVFTLGLTESWINSEFGYEYPVCPGTISGIYDKSRHKFVNQDFPFIKKTLIEVIHSIRKINPKMKFILTVSPVPLTATMSGSHVLIATMESKSILRSVAGALAKQFKFVDYFPSYEIINSTPYRGVFFESNLRNVNHVGVDHVMGCFFKCLDSRFSSLKSDEKKDELKSSATNSQVASHNNFEDVVCEEELLNAFSRK